MRTISTNIACAFMEACIEQGADREEMLRLLPDGAHTMLTARHDMYIPRLPARLLLDILQKGAELANKPHIGLICGQQMRQSSMGLLGPTLLLCKNFMQAVSLRKRYQGLHQDICVTRTRLEHDLTFTKMDVYEEFVSHKAIHSFIETNMVLHASFTYWMTWLHNIKCVGIHFVHEQPEYIEEYRKIFDCDIKFGQKENAIILNSKAMYITLPQYNEKKLSKNCRLLDAQMELVRQAVTIKHQAIMFLKIYGNDLIFNLDDLAREMGMSGRTLRRKLLEEGSSYSEVLAEARKQICVNMIERGLSFVQISRRLGFRQQSSFNRAFKAWFGQSPKSYARSYNI